MTERDLSLLPRKYVRQEKRLVKTNPKDFMVENFRLAFLTQDQSRALYNKIRENIVNELLQGKRINLFGIVMLEPMTRNYNTGFHKEERVVKSITRIRAKISSNFRTEWKKAYVQCN